MVCSIPRGRLRLRSTLSPGRIVGNSSISPFWGIPQCLSGINYLSGLTPANHKHNNGTDLKIGQVFLRLSTSMTFYYHNWGILLVYPLPVNTGVA